MKKIVELSKKEGLHQIMINSKTPITKEQIEHLIPPGVKVVVEGPRVLWKDVKECLPLHIGIVLLTGGLGLIPYVGFWLYEKWKPLYIVYLDVGHTDDFVNPLLKVKIDYIEEYN